MCLVMGFIYSAKENPTLFPSKYYLVKGLGKKNRFRNLKFTHCIVSSSTTGKVNLEGSNKKERTHTGTK
jgi:hypothetical protein